MLGRMTISALLKSVIVVFGVAVVIMLSLNVWDSWSRLRAADRAAAVTEASNYLFTALHNLRIDSASSYRDMLSDQQQTTLEPLLRNARAGDMPALKGALDALQQVEFPNRDALVGELAQRTARLAELHKETAAALAQPKAARPSALADEMLKETTALLDLLDRLSTQITTAIKLQDSFTDQLMELKELAWVVRNAGGDCSVIVSNTLGGRPIPANAMEQYIANVSKVDTAWAALKNLASGLPLPLLNL